MSNISILRDVKDAIRNPYAWPGGYPKFILMADGEALSPEGAKQGFREIVFACLHNKWRDGWMPAAVDINWENPDLYCAHTNERIPSAYAEPDEEAA